VTILTLSDSEYRFGLRLYKYTGDIDLYVLTYVSTVERIMLTFGILVRGVKGTVP
jgi:hypothetical protein